MVDYRDIRETSRSYRHSGTGYTVTIFEAENGFFLKSVKVDGFPERMDSDSGGHPDREAAFAAGQRLGEKLIG